MKTVQIKVMGSAVSIDGSIYESPFTGFLEIIEAIDNEQL